MKIQILNDLHTELCDFTIPETDADVLVLAGDIGVGLGGLEWFHTQQFNKPVIYVPGNHEFYHHDTSLVEIMQRNAAIDVHVLNNNAIEIAGVRFLGCTLWTDFNYFGVADKFSAMEDARKNMNDFSVIKHHGIRFTPENSIALHHESRVWLASMLSDSYGGKTVVVTHHAPSSLSVHPRFASDLLTAAFASSLEGVIDGSGIALWVHGHTHDSFDYDLFGTRVVCNPRGYLPYESSNGFVPGLVVEV